MAAISKVTCLSQKLGGAEPSISAQYRFLWIVDFQKTIGEYIMHHIAVGVSTGYQPF